MDLRMIYLYFCIKDNLGMVNYMGKGKLLTLIMIFMKVNSSRVLSMEMESIDMLMEMYIKESFIMI